MSILRLDDFDVPGFDIRVSVGLELKGEDASGDTSSTARADKGTKGKRLDVKLKIRFENEHMLRALFNFAEQKSNGDGQIYLVTNNTANAVGMREAKFSGKLQADEQENAHMWLVSFCLEEHKSVPERAAGRENSPKIVTQDNEGEPVADPLAMATGGAINAGEQAQDLSMFERFLKTVDDSLAGEDR